MEKTRGRRGKDSRVKKEKITGSKKELSIFLAGWFQFDSVQFSFIFDEEKESFGIFNVAEVSQSSSKDSCPQGHQKRKKEKKKRKGKEKEKRQTKNKDRENTYTIQVHLDETVKGRRWKEDKPRSQRVFPLCTFSRSTKSKRVSSEKSLK